ncbi:MAG: hypothetical protein Q3979_06930, partial [Actinomycetaceae bacterium]|nr:hypothetical protein [Actinomycetaceae bacterium]
MTRHRTSLSGIVFAGLLASTWFGPAAQAGANGSGAADGDDSSTVVMAPTTFGREATSAVPAASGENVASENVSAEEASQKEQVLAYWTDERLAAAEPLDDERSAGNEREMLGYAAGQEEPEGSTEPAAPSQEALDAQAA